MAQISWHRHPGTPGPELRLAARGATFLRQIRHDLKVRRFTAHFAAGAGQVEQAEAYAQLTPFSLAAAGVRTEARSARHLTVVLPELRVGAMFAGIRTAAEVAVELAAALDLSLRVVVLWGAPRGAGVADTQEFFARELGYAAADPVQVLPVEQLVGLSVNPDDVWLVTHWSTAHPVDVACRLGVLAPDQVIYLVQDYEPGFHAWSDQYALARSTYHAGFAMIVNSTPLQTYLAEAEAVKVDDDHVFAPRLDLERLEQAALRRQRSETTRVLFYGRPSRPRNLFDIGSAAVRLAAAELAAAGRPARFVSAGEAFPSQPLAGGTRLEVRGKVAWADYFTLLADSDVVLSLQHSPHPSHPPLDAVVSGAWAVTNDLGGTRGGLHDRLLVAEPDPAALADRVVQAAAYARGRVGAYDPGIVDRLGSPLRDVVARVAGEMKAESGR